MRVIVDVSEWGEQPMAGQPIRLKALLQERHWQTYSTFCREYDRVARTIDPTLVGTYPSRAQLHRWLSGEVKSLPYPDHCRVLEEMLPGWAAAELFESGPIRPATSEPPEPSIAYGADLDVFVDMNEEDNRLIAQRIRQAQSIFFAAHTGYAAMVSQYQAAVRQAVANGARLKVVVSNPDGPLMREPELSRRLCPSIRQAGEISDVLATCRRHHSHAARHGRPADAVEARVYDGLPSMNVLLVDDWLRVVPYLPLVDAAECPVFEFSLDPANPSPLISKYLMSIERLWADSHPVDLTADADTPLPHAAGVL